MHEIRNDELDQIFGGVALSGRPKKQIDDDYKLYPVPYPRDAAGSLATVASAAPTTDGLKATAATQGFTAPSTSLQHGGKLQSRPAHYRFNFFMNSAK